MRGTKTQIYQAMKLPTDNLLMSNAVPNAICARLCRITTCNHFINDMVHRDLWEPLWRPEDSTWLKSLPTKNRFSTLHVCHSTSRIITLFISPLAGASTYIYSLPLLQPNPHFNANLRCL